MLLFALAFPAYLVFTIVELWGGTATLVLPVMGSDPGVPSASDIKKLLETERLERERREMEQETESVEVAATLDDEPRRLQKEKTKKDNVWVVEDWYDEAGGYWAKTSFVKKGVEWNVTSVQFCNLTHASQERPNTQRTQLGMGETKTACVAAEYPWNDIGIFVAPGEVYKYTVREPEFQLWVDYNFNTTAAGYANKWFRTICCDDQWVDLRHWESQRKVPFAKWSELSCCYRKAITGKEAEYCFTIGAGATVTVPNIKLEEGETALPVYCFANDIPEFYWDNVGFQYFDIDRVG